MKREPYARPLAEGAADVVARLRRAMRQAARVRRPANPLSVAQLELLSVVEEHAGARPGDLAVLLRLAPNSVSTLANGLVTLGMLVRSPGATDRRTVQYRLTDQGRQLVHQWRVTNSHLLQEAIAAMPAQERQDLATALPALNSLVEAINIQATRRRRAQENLMAGFMPPEPKAVF